MPAVAARDQLAGVGALASNGRVEISQTAIDLLVKLAVNTNQGIFMHFEKGKFDVKTLRNPSSKDRGYDFSSSIGVFSERDRTALKELTRRQPANEIDIKPNMTAKQIASLLQSKGAYIDQDAALASNQEAAQILGKIKEIIKHNDGLANIEDRISFTKSLSASDFSRLLELMKDLKVAETYRDVVSALIADLELRKAEYEKYSQEVADDLRGGTLDYPWWAGNEIMAIAIKIKSNEELKAEIKSLVPEIGTSEAREILRKIFTDLKNKSNLEGLSLLKAELETNKRALGYAMDTGSGGMAYVFTLTDSFLKEVVTAMEEIRAGTLYKPLAKESLASNGTSNRKLWDDLISQVIANMVNLDIITVAQADEIASQDFHSKLGFLLVLASGKISHDVAIRAIPAEKMFVIKRHTPKDETYYYKLGADGARGYADAQTFDNAQEIKLEMAGQSQAAKTDVGVPEDVSVGARLDRGQIDRAI